MAGLLDRVVSESYIGAFGNEVSPAIESEVNSRIINDEDSSDMMQYTGECLMGMLAIETVVAQKEGEVSVEYMIKRQNGDNAALEALVATFEGFLGDAWEKIKEWVKKAYTAVKNFLIKIWNKLKGYGNTIKAFFTKYGDVLRSMKIPSSFKVEWGTINILAAKNTYDTHITTINTIMTSLNSTLTKINASDTRGASGDEHLRHMLDGNGTGSSPMPSPHQIQSEINKAIYGQESGYEKKEEPFDSKKAEIIEAADIGNVSKYINNFLGLGDQNMKYDLGVIDNHKKQVEKGADARKENHLTKILAAERRCINAKLQLHRMVVAAMTSAAKHKISLAVSACRKAIMYHSTKGEGATPTTDSWDPSSSASFDEMFATIM